MPHPYQTTPQIIDGFLYSDWLVLGRSPSTLKRGNREAMYVVMEDYTVTLAYEGRYMQPARADPITVPKGMTTDMASVPKIFRNIIGRIGPHLEACIVHDWLYIAWQMQDRMPTREDHDFANRVLYAGLKAAKCHWVTRVGMWIAMEFPFISWSVFKGRDKDLFLDLDMEGYSHEKS